MATVVEQRSQPPHFGGMGYDTMRYSAGPQFTNPWATANDTNPHAHLYNPQLPPTSAPVDQHHTARTLYPTSAAPAHAPLPQDTMPQQRAYPTDYVTAAPAGHSSYAPTAGVRYSPEHYPTVPTYAPYDQRRDSYMKPMSGADSFKDALDASRGMVAMSQDMTTPRNIYGPRNGSQDSYPFPATHNSPHSSISSASGYPYYAGSYAGSVDGSVAGSSVTDYSSASEDPIGQRTLPAPGQMISGFPPEPQSMMTQFNSKLAASATKKHKCKICDKRFTRPSSLQTHMYSHTGEKPFACDYEGCGRHFSVVSNLRRHKKCHKGGSQDRTSPEEE